MKKSIDPMWWSFFGAGGALSAIFLPVLVVFLGIAAPFGWVDLSYEYMSVLLNPWYSRLLLLAIISLSMFHWAHRFRFTLHEGLQLQQYDKLIAGICYGISFAISGLAAGIFMMP